MLAEAGEHGTVVFVMAIPHALATLAIPCSGERGYRRQTVGTCLETNG
jgi:hypothetical protein